jgi:hypothetical protein
VRAAGGEDVRDGRAPVGQGAALRIRVAAAGKPANRCDWPLKVAAMPHVVAQGEDRPHLLEQVGLQYRDRATRGSGGRDFSYVTVIGRHLRGGELSAATLELGSREDGDPLPGVLG